jgi:hypothetical protein
MTSVSAPARKREVDSFDIDASAGGKGCSHTGAPMRTGGVSVIIRERSSDRSGVTLTSQFQKKPFQFSWCRCVKLAL